MQLNRLWFNLADPHLWARQVGHDRHTAADGFRRRADALDAFRVTSEVAVREVEPRDVQARADEAFQHFRGFRGWSDRSDDFSFVPGERHRSRSRINSDSNGFAG